MTRYIVITNVKKCISYLDLHVDYFKLSIKFLLLFDKSQSFSSYL